jgi:transposase-like protein
LDQPSAASNTIRAAAYPGQQPSARRYVYRAIDQYGQVIDGLVSARRDAAAARRFFRRAITAFKVTPTEVVTDAAAVYPAVLDELLPSAWHHIEQYANNPIEADHGQLKHRLRPMRGLQTDRTAQVVIARHAFIRNNRRQPVCRHNITEEHGFAKLNPSRFLRAGPRVRVSLDELGSCRP